MTWKEALIRLYGIEKKRIAQQRNFREVAYSIHIHAVESKHRMNVFDFMPLAGDPTKEELREMEARKQKRIEKELTELYQQAQLLMNAANKARA